ncbi:MAG: UvrD-helicase domain-containing protein [Acidimicrobiales bacterium]
MTAPADQASRDLIGTTGLARTLFVEAGAGTGKTTALVERVKNLVLEAGVPLERIAAITFTEAAASELRDRIRVAFEKERVEASDEHRRMRCDAAIDATDLAAISTLHGFARRILGDHPLAVGLPLRVTILDEVSSALARERWWERFVDALYDDPANEEVLTRAALCDLPLEPRYQGHATLKGIAVALNQSWDRIDAAADTVHAPLEPVDFGPFDRAARDVEALPDRCLDPSDALFAHLRDTVLPALRAVTGQSAPDQKLRALKDATWRPGAGGKAVAWGGDVGGAKARIKTLNTARDDLIRAVSNDLLQRLVSLVCAAVRVAAEARRREGALEFHDLLVLCRRLLRTDPEARNTLHHRYTHLLLDEFQDTDPIQIELAVLIASAVDDAAVVGGPVDGEPVDGGEGVPAWDGAHVEAGKLFFVGDPKQSIYRFRRADIDLFLRARDAFGGAEGAIKLVSNFRTVPPVVHWLNGLFGQLMPAEVERSQPAYEALVAHRDLPGDADHRPVLLGGPHHQKLKAAELRTAEANDVTLALDAIRRNPSAWPVFDRDQQRWRPAGLSDVTILVPTRTSLPYLRTALATGSIPYRINTGNLVYDTQEVRDLLSTLAAVADPTDELATISALRSALYACSDTELFSFKDAGSSWDFRAPSPAVLGDGHPVVAACTHLRTLWEQHRWLTPSGLLDRVIRDRHAFLLGFGDRRPKEVWARLRFLLDQARAFEEADGGDLRSFLGWAELQRSEGAQVHEPVLPETDDQAVQVMTIHGSKGLEFPITIVSGTTTRPGRTRSGASLLWDEDGSPQVKLSADVATTNHDPRADLEMEMDSHEKLRLLYVACTRARDHLLVSCHHLPGDGSYGEVVWQHSQSLVESWRALGDEPEPPAATGATPAVEAPPDDRQAWVAARDQLLGLQRVPTVTSATAIAAAMAAAMAAPSDLGDAIDHPITMDDRWRDDDPAQDEPSGATPARRRGRAGTAIGRAVHATLQRLDLREPTDIEAEAGRQAYLEGVSGLSDTVSAMVRSALGSDAVRLAATHPHHKELFLSAPIGETVVEGYVDLLVETQDGLVIVDYKTDGVRSAAEVDAKVDFYASQGGAYAVVLEAVTGQTVTECRFVFCRPGGAIERTVDDLGSVTHRVRAHLNSMAAPTITRVGLATDTRHTLPLW